MKELITEKFCTKCSELKSIDNFYLQDIAKGKYQSYCKACDKLDYIKYQNEHGGWHVKNNPGEYVNKYQKQAVFELMLKLKWRYSERTKTWYKSGIKTKDGKWPKIKERKEKPLIEKIRKEPKFKFLKFTKKLSYTREYHQEYWKTYYEKHKDELNAEKRRKRNRPRKPKVIQPPKVKKKKDNSERSKRRWRENNKEHLRAYRASLKEYYRQYYKEHKEQILANKRRRRK